MKRVLWAASLAAVLGLVAVAIVAPGEAARAMGWHHGGRGTPDPEHMKEHLVEGVDFALGRVDATDEQRARASEIATTAFDALAPVVAEHRGNREEIAALLGAETIDREALEALRVREMALLEDASQTLLSSFADLAETLTPEQRAELLEHHDHEGHGGWRRHW